MYKNIGAYYISDGEVMLSETFNGLDSDRVIYEVIRVINGKVLFLEDHMKRLEYSLDKVSIVADVNVIKDEIIHLISINEQMDKNIKLDVIEGHYRIYFMESYYPNEELYKTGVATTAVKLQRHNPTVKQLDMDYKHHIEMIKGDQFFEVLLINLNDKITEGSRANLVFVKDNTLYSAPLEEILTGITFENVIKMSQTLGLNIQYESVGITELDEMEGCFLTGTSLGVLPIKSIDHHIYDSANHPIVLKLIQAYTTQMN
ncbi:MAG: aminotransferase class IV family protein [Clostridiales bacterium]|nr:aminotransferase class IV family protein [Clostridiales bacterium]